MLSFAHEYRERRRSIDPIGYATSLLGTAFAPQAQHRHGAAEPLLRRALDEFVEPLSVGDQQSKDLCQQMLAECLAQHDETLIEAEQIFRHLLNLKSLHSAGTSPKTSVRQSLARVLRKQHRNSEAEEIYRRLLDGPEALSDRVRTNITMALCQVLRDQEKLAEAEVVARQASEAALIHGPADLRSQHALLILGTVKLGQKAYGEAASTLGQACDAIATPYHQFHFQCLHAMGHTLRCLQRHDESASFYTRALDGYTQMLGSDHVSTQALSRELNECRASLARETETKE